MHVLLLDDAEAFLTATLALRAADPVGTNVIGSVAQSVVEGRHYERQHWFVVEDDGEVVGAAIWTPPYKLLVPRLSDEAADRVAAAALALDDELVGVVGPVDTAHRVAAAAGRSARVEMREKLLVLGDYVRPTPIPGRSRRATEADVDLATDWMTQFAADSGALVPDPRASVEGRLGALWFWDVDGEPVSIAGHASLVTTPAGVVARVGPVFTPAALRRRGYGAAVTAAVVEALLPTVDTVMLYTDAANSTSNGVYERLGFAHVAEVVELALEVPSR